MKLVTFSTKSRTSNTQPASASVPAAALSVDIPTPGVLINDEIVDLSSLGYPTVLSIIEAGQPALDEIQAKLSKAPRIPLASVILGAPLRPPRIFGIGLNYQKHADESKMPVQKLPPAFMNLSNSVVGPDQPIIPPNNTPHPHHQPELTA